MKFGVKNGHYQSKDLTVCLLSRPGAYADNLADAVNWLLMFANVVDNKGAVIIKVYRGGWRNSQIPAH